MPEEWQGPLRLVGTLATQAGVRAYLVGGAVRDLLLQRPILDTDLALEGGVTEVARALAETLGGQAVLHRRFGTATVRWRASSGPVPGARALDLVTTRRERYPRPGALPEVSPGTIVEDLQRRDFSIHALAFSLSLDRWGELLDPQGGLADLRHGLIRALHPRSFQDDATRILRAIRYEQRLGFHLEAQTEQWLRQDREYLNTISGDRLRRELDRLLEEPQPERALGRAQQLSVLDALLPGLHFGAGLAESFQKARRLAGAGRQRRTLLSLWLWSLPETVGRDLLERLHSPSGDRRAGQELWGLRPRLAELAAPELTDPQLAALCDGLQGETLTVLALEAPEPIATRVLRYQTTLKQQKPLLGGAELQALGVAPGPLLGQLLRRLQVARWAGQARTRTEEEALIRRWLQEAG